MRIIEQGLQPESLPFRVDPVGGRDVREPQVSAVGREDRHACVGRHGSSPIAQPAAEEVIEAAEAFLDTGRTYYARANTLSMKAVDGPPVKEAIAKFIDAN